MASLLFKTLIIPSLETPHLCIFHVLQPSASLQVSGIPGHLNRINGLSESTQPMCVALVCPGFTIFPSLYCSANPSIPLDFGTFLLMRTQRSSLLVPLSSSTFSLSGTSIAALATIILALISNICILPRNRRRRYEQSNKTSLEEWSWAPLLKDQEQ